MRVGVRYTSSVNYHPAPPPFAMPPGGRPGCASSDRGATARRRSSSSLTN
jgi:hypothetical protein